MFEYCGSTIRALSMEERMTVCNMSIEAGARAGLVAPDDTTFQYLHGRPFAPTGRAWDAAVARWRQLPTDDGAFDREVSLDADALEPMITFGTNPGMGIPITEPGARPGVGADRVSASRSRRRWPTWISRPASRWSATRSTWSSSEAARTGGCRDLREAASILHGRKVIPSVRMLVVPGSREVKRQAEAEGLDRIFRDAGAEWREAGLLDVHRHERRPAASPAQYSVSTSNRNFEGRQGPGGRTFLASPLTAAASAVTGVVTDARRLRMTPFTALREPRRSRSPIDNIDTDQIIPARFLKTISRAGLGDQLFHDWRYDAAGAHGRTSS